MLSFVSAYNGGTLSQIQDAREGKKFPRAVGEGNTVGSPAFSFGNNLILQALTGPRND